MNYLSKDQFKRKYLTDNSVKNFIVNNQLTNTVNKSKPVLTTDNKVKDLTPSNTDQQREEGLKELVHDAISVKRKEILDVDIKDLLNMGIKIMDSKRNKSSDVNVNFTFGDLVKQCHEHPEKAEVIDI